MPDTIITPAPPAEATNATFAPMYYDSPVEQIVLEFDVTADDSLAASITAGGPYFKVEKIDVCNWVVVPIPGPPHGPGGPVGPGGHPMDIVADGPSGGFLAGPVNRVADGPTTRRVLSAPVAASDGVAPLAVKNGQFARLWVTASVPKGAALAPGPFAGTAVLKGKDLTRNVAFEGTYLGTLMGKVTVDPAVVTPGQHVRVQVLNASGEPMSDPAVTVTMQGVPASARYYQFGTVGDRTLIINASRGALKETTQATVKVQGEPMAFRPSAPASPVTEMPILQVAWVPGSPYAATFTLGTTLGVRRVLASGIKMTAPAPAPAPAHGTAPAVVGVPAADALGDEFTKLLPTLPAEKVTQIAEKSIKTATGVFTTSGVLARIGGLETEPATTSYKWDFGDGQTLTTQSPTATHDYLPSIKAGDVAHSFDVTCTIVLDDITVKRTLVLHSSYGLCRRLGVIVPPVVATAAYATFQHVAYSASLVVTNLEAAPIALDSMACVPVSDDTAVAPPAPVFTDMNAPLVLNAASATAIGVFVTLDQLKLPGGAVANGFVVLYTGQVQGADGTSTPVRFSCAFRIPLTDSGLASATVPPEFAPGAWDLDTALQAVTGLATQPAAAVSKAGGLAVDPATRAVAIALAADPADSTTLARVRSALGAGLTSIALKTGALTAKGTVVRLSPAALVAPAPPVMAPDDVKFDPLGPHIVAAGQECYPDDISDADAATAADQQLVCQLTNETHTATIPASFQNAQQGDIILSPAPVESGDLIAAMFGALTPPQHHGHSGIMTANFFEITHCTAADKRITDNVHKDALGIPTSLDSDMLQYAWPGSLTQSIDDATTSASFKDPDGTKYQMNGFNTDARGDGFEIIYPLVVKPLPENEAKVRPTLRKAADLARSKGARYDQDGNPLQKGGCYYSFYAYTNPQLSAGFGDPAPAAAGWAAGLSPAVCSSFVWLSLKSCNVPLVTAKPTETLADFSPQAVAGGIQVGPATPDGLVFYPQAERLQGGEALRQMLMDQALSQEDGLGTIPGVNDNIAGPIADQLLNTFASGNPNLVGSDAWKNPGDANAVSPDNMIWWNPPYYGYAEPLQFLPRHTEQYTVSRWTKVITWGSIKGTVRYNGAPVPNAHVWVYLPGGDTFTAADGTYTLNHVPIGMYGLKAQAVISSNGVNGEYTNGPGQPVTLTKDDPDIVQDVDLQGLPQNYRRLDFSFSISCDHGDANPFNTHGVQSAGPFYRSAYLNPGQVTGGVGYTYDYNGGGYFHIDYSFTVALVEDLSIEVALTGTMYDDGGGFQDQYSLTPFNVPMGQSVSGYISMEHSDGYHNGPAKFTFTATNNQQTG